VVAPAVDFATLDEAFVVLQQPDPERERIRETVDSLEDAGEGSR
jgi:hypothetical protein